MVRDAETHADEDRKFRELVDTRNRADGLIHEVRKQLDGLGDQVEATERGEVEGGIEALETAVKGDDKSAIEHRIEALSQLGATLAAKTADTTARGKAGSDEEGVVDAEFEDVSGNTGA